MKKNPASNLSNIIFYINMDNITIIRLLKNISHKGHGMFCFVIPHSEVNVDKKDLSVFL